MRRVLTRWAAAGAAGVAAAIWGVEAVTYGLVVGAAVVVTEAAWVVWSADVTVRVRAGGTRGRPPKEPPNGRA